MRRILILPGGLKSRLGPKLGRLKVRGCGHECRDPRGTITCSLANVPGISEYKKKKWSALGRGILSQDPDSMFILGAV